jgi:NAD(P)-dependent dehydrogenase (short-subunit alcohol dehydrogenase family)
VERLADETCHAFGAAHVVCNNAGVAVIGGVHEHTLEDWQWVINVNLWGVIHGVRAFLPRMLTALSDRLVGAIHRRRWPSKSSRASGRDASTSCPLSPR